MNGSAATNRLLEICVDSPRSVAAAIAGGAHQVELCSALAVGGLTPSAGLTRATVALCRPAGVAVRAMVRVRPGGFVHDAADLTLAIEEARALVAEGVDGVVFGATQDRRLDGEALATFVTAIRADRRDIGLTLHRAIDKVADPVAAVGQAIALGFDQILTSGGEPSAWEGRSTIARMVVAAAGRCRIVAGAGVRPDNAAALLLESRADGLHGTARGTAAPASQPDRLGFGETPRSSDADVVKALRHIVDDATFI